VLDFTHRLWPAGFYNKIFKWPNWHWYEGAVRRMAGLGELPSDEDRNRYFHHNLHCDVLIAGAGPAGLAAALSAMGSGARVLLVEQDCELGGSLLGGAATVDGIDSGKWVSRAGFTLVNAPNVTVMTSSTVSAYYDNNVLTVTDRSTAGIKRFWKIRAGQVVLATGAVEQPLVFENNDRPGIMLAGAVLEYVNRYAVRPADSMAVATNNDTAYRAAFAMHDHGIHVPAIIDARDNVADELACEASQRGIPVMAGSVVMSSVGVRGLKGIRTVKLSGDGQSTAGGSGTVACRGLAMSGGFNPTVHLYSQAGGELRYDDGLGCFVPGEPRQGVTVAGAARGGFSLGDALADGARAGSEAAGKAGFACAPVHVTTGAAGGYGLRATRITPAGDASRQWVDFMHDVTVADIELAVRENFVSVEHLKRYTTTGMAADQGKTSNLNALTLLAKLTSRPIGDIGTTTFRPQFMPVPLGAIAGQQRRDLYTPVRLLPAHDWHAGRGAVFENYGAWKRPEYYAVEGRDREIAIREELLAVRRGAGLFDASTLGKIELTGPDAGEFLNRIFVNNVLTLKSGRIRYWIMLNENGIVTDDGVVARLADEHYLVSSTSAGADHFTGWLEHWHQCEWPGLELVMSPVTSQWAVATVAGPQARDILQEMESDIDFSAQALPHMAVASGTFLGVPARVQRVSFTGEMSFEINVPARHGERVMEAIMNTGGDRIVPFGIEAVIVLRTEKGFLEVGADTDGTTNALDVGFGGIVAKKQADFVGKRSLLRAWDQRGDRRQFVGVEPLNEAEHLEPGAHLVTSNDRGRRSQGFVTSACFSPALNRAIGLGLLENGFERKGEIVTVFDEGRTFEARITDPDFYDPGGEKMHA
jgi:sarcosine oxidase subunit alpha